VFTGLKWPTIKFLEQRMTYKILTDFVKQNKAGTVLGLALIGIGSFLLGRWAMTWITPSHGMAKKGNEAAQTLLDRNKRLAEQIQGTEIPNFQTVEIMSQMESALEEGKVAHRIFDNVFLGGQDADVFEEEGKKTQLDITCLLSASIYFNNPRILNNTFRFTIGIGTKIRGSKDLGQSEICNLGNLRPAFGIIDRVREKNENILVQCQQGKDRSATVIAAYLVSRCSISAERAFGFIRSKRIIADPLPMYIDWVKANEAELRAINSESQ
jgi:hypothetical protein